MPPHKAHDPAVGINLGTCYSSVGVWQPRQRRFEILANEHGNRTTPSVVGFCHAECLVGQSAASNPDNTVFNAKRLIGRRYSDADAKLLPLKVHADSDSAGRPTIDVSLGGGQHRSLSPEDVSAMVLAKMRAVAEAELGGPVARAVVTVPACFTETQRRAIRRAATTAGLKVLRLLNEPTAAALAYALHTRPRTAQNVVVFDLGGSCFEVAVVHIRKPCRLTVRSVAGDAHLGGQDFNRRMLVHLLHALRRRHGVDVAADAVAFRRLEHACEKAKRELSFSAETFVDVPAMPGWAELQVRLKRSKFEQLTADLFQRCMALLRRCLLDACLTTEDVHKVVLVGGSTRIPRIQELLRDFFKGREGAILCKIVHVAGRDAIGAAMVAAGRHYNGPEFSFKDVMSRAVGVGFRGGEEMSLIVPRNTPLPATYDFDLSAFRDGHRPMCINVYESSGLAGGSVCCVGGWTVNRPGTANGMVCLGLRLQVDADGMIRVAAEDRSIEGFREPLRFRFHADADSEGHGDSDCADVATLQEAVRLREHTAALRNELELSVLEAKRRAYRLSRSADVLTDLEAVAQWLSEQPSVGAHEITKQLKHVHGVLAAIQCRENLHLQHRDLQLELELEPYPDRLVT